MSYSFDYKEGGKWLCEDDMLVLVGVVDGDYFIVYFEIVVG